MKRIVYLLLCALLWAVSPACLGQTGDSKVRAALEAQISWDADRQGHFVTCLAQDRQGNIWAGTEGNGVWCLRQKPHDAPQWVQYVAKDGLADDNIYALTVDLRGRIWAGTSLHGVSVFNGQVWRNYASTGSLGKHVVSIACNPLDGGVWIASDAGLTRYQNLKWMHYTRQNGIPADQAEALTFDEQGVLYVATQSDGLLLGKIISGSVRWSRGGALLGPKRPGALGMLANCLMAQGGRLYCGLDVGLATSIDHGMTWGLRRDDSQTNQFPEEETSEAPLLQGCVTCLARDTLGNLWIGHREKGCEVVSLSGERIYPDKGQLAEADHARAILPLSDGTVLIACYGDGITAMSAGETISVVASRPSYSPTLSAPFPTPQQAATVELRRRSLGIFYAHLSLAPGASLYLGDDWESQGDWRGKYGAQCAVLCAAGAPKNHYIIRGKYIVGNDTGDTQYRVLAQIGLHRRSDDRLRYWIHWFRTDDKRSLFDPIPGYRRQAEWDDHGEVYERNSDGPSLYVTVFVPPGYHRVTLYFFNKDGHTGDNRDRDYTLEVIGYTKDLRDAETAPVLAHARVSNFWGGVYKSFLMFGGAYYIKIGRNGSHNTILSGVFIDPR